MSIPRLVKHKESIFHPEEHRTLPITGLNDPEEYLLFSLYLRNLYGSPSWADGNVHFHREAPDYFHLYSDDDDFIPIPVGSRAIFEIKHSWAHHGSRFEWYLIELKTAFDPSRVGIDWFHTGINGILKLIS